MRLENFSPLQDVRPRTAPPTVLEAPLGRFGDLRVLTGIQIAGRDPWDEYGPLMQHASNGYDIASSTGNPTWDDTDTVSQIDVTVPTGWGSMDVCVRWSASVWTTAVRPTFRLYDDTNGAVLTGGFRRHNFAQIVDSNDMETVELEGWLTGVSATTSVHQQWLTTTASKSITIEDADFFATKYRRS